VIGNLNNSDLEGGKEDVFGFIT